MTTTDNQVEPYKSRSLHIINPSVIGYPNCSGNIDKRQISALNNSYMSRHIYDSPN